MKFLDAGVTVFFQEKGSISFPKQKKPLETLDFQRHYAMMLRKVRDSNPRTSYPVTAFRVRPVRPLRQLSKKKDIAFQEVKKVGKATFFAL